MMPSVTVARRGAAGLQLEADPQFVGVWGPGTPSRFFGLFVAELTRRPGILPVFEEQSRNRSGQSGSVTVADQSQN